VRRAALFVLGFLFVMAAAAVAMAAEPEAAKVLTPDVKKVRRASGSPSPLSEGRWGSPAPSSRPWTASLATPQPQGGS